VLEAPAQHALRCRVLKLELRGQSALEATLAGAGPLPSSHAPTLL